MSFFYNITPAFTDITGVPFEGGQMFFGDPNVDPKNNPKNIFLDEALSIPADNPQTLDSRGVCAQGTIYMEDDASQYSILLEDVLGNQIFNVPAAVGVSLGQDLSTLPPVTILGSATIFSNTTAELNLDSGVPTGEEGQLNFKEAGILQWQWLRQAIIDGGAILLRRVVGVSSPDEPLEFPLVGGMIARWLGTDRIRVESDGVAILGLLKNNPQVLVAAGTYLAAGTAVGNNFGVIGSAGSSGAFTVTLDFFPVAEVDLQVVVCAEVGDAPLLAWGEGGANGTGTVLIKTDATATSFTFLVFDMGRV